ncbi:CPBP family intramembrane glutamic endopeptidase [Yoonia sp. 208BN28-4]|uniref:CPBP family intramembrane glutamic endopeptidase n=1 Tax=Yoonia sp. 208BN28-4 TaxID=3126505 RepID=UPI0030951234
MTGPNPIRDRTLWLTVLAIWLALRFYWPFPQLVWWQTMGLLYGLLMIGAIVIMGGKLRYVFDAEDKIYADSTGGWHWRRSWIILPVLAAIWILVLGLTAMTGTFHVDPARFDILLMVFATQVFMVGLGEELFFREAGIKASAGNPIWLFVFAVGLFGAIHWQGGVFAILVAVGLGAVYLATRLAGVPILIVALMHGINNTVSRYVIWLDISNQVVYAVLFVLGCFALAAAIVALAGVYERRRGP